jgi:hypothetical protein
VWLSSALYSDAWYLMAATGSGRVALRQICAENVH